VKGSLLLGSAAQFSQNAVKFLHAAHRQYGDVFTIRLVNQYLTIVMDPHSYEAVSREKNFDFDPIQKQVTFTCTTRRPDSVDAKQILWCYKTVEKHLGGHNTTMWLSQQRFCSGWLAGV